jgi:hypothetical protein
MPRNSGSECRGWIVVASGAVPVHISAFKLHTAGRDARDALRSIESRLLQISDTRCAAFDWITDPGGTSTFILKAAKLGLSPAPQLRIRTAPSPLRSVIVVIGGPRVPSA